MGASASLGASEPAPDAADAMATPVVEPAPEAAADATPEAAADATTPEPEAKRPHAAADLLGSLAKEGNLSAILGFAGYRTVLTLETLSWRARRAARDARIELDVTHETRQNRLMKIFYRAELLDLRRRKAFPDKMLYSLFYLFDGWKHRASDVQFDGRRVLLLCPPPRRLHGVVAVRDRAGSLGGVVSTPPRSSTEARPPPRHRKYARHRGGSSEVRPPPRSLEVRPPPRGGSSEVAPPPRGSSKVRPATVAGIVREPDRSGRRERARRGAVVDLARRRGALAF